MRNQKLNQALYLLVMMIFGASCQENNDTDPAMDVITRIAGARNAHKFELQLDKSGDENYAVEVRNDKIHILGSSQVALCRGAYDYLSNACNSIVSWSGNRLHIPEKLPPYSSKVRSNFKYHFYFNVVTHGYTTSYWDWPRWEKEIDWMAMHGIDMPLIPGAHEAILYRVFKKIGVSDTDIQDYFTGPAYFPFNRMGCITGWDGPLPASFYEKQVTLTHQILDRLGELDMHPIIPAFAGFVPSGIRELYPEEKLRKMAWGGFEEKYQAYILEPGSELFIDIGKLYISEWEKEFGKSEFYLADSFNEMDVPLSQDSVLALEELSKYGESVYRSIKESNPEAIWVMQGWTFPYHMKDGELFWTPDRLRALISKVPDDKLLILDLANEYNRLWWKIEPSWKIYDGFFGKKWIYSFIPNMGGKTSLNGRLDLYAKMPFEALDYADKGNLVGFGFAPEGIENNEIVYELLSDAGWAQEEINLREWTGKYCLRRYGAFPQQMEKAFEYFNASCFGSFTDHPRHTYQFRPNSKNHGTVNRSDDFTKGVALFLACKDSCKNNSLYKVDAIEYTCQYLGLKADSLLEEFKTGGGTNYALLDEALNILSNIDRLLESHPNWKLQNWITYARKYGDTPEEQAYYESNARRIITTWGGWVNEYSARTWSGLIRDYYSPRWKLYYQSKMDSVPFDMEVWEEAWIHSGKISEVQPFDDPVEMAYSLFTEMNDKR